MSQNLQLESALREYQFIREEMLQRQNQRMTMTYILLLVMAMLYVGAYQSKTPWLVGVTPYFSFFILYQVHESYKLHDIQVEYVRRIEDRVNNLLLGTCLGWQNYFDHQVKNKKVERLVRKNTYLLIMWLSIVFSLLVIFKEYVLPLTEREITLLLSSIFLVITIILGVIITFYFLKKNKNKELER